ncbi:MAG: glycosyltransferase [Pyrinomonadaceae bacterium]|nr:glycosyltransferase [Sphingobacteriaceae bacterium]
MPNTLAALWIFLQLLVGFNLVFPFVLYCIYKISKKKEATFLPLNNKPDYAVIITAYQYINTLPDVVTSALKLNYNNYLIYVVADNCDVSSLHFSDERVVLLRPPEVLRGNTKSHFYAIHNFKRDHEIITIIDSDNLVDPEYLNQLNTSFNLGFDAVQGIREAKNLDTTYACLDAARDIYYHFFDCKVLFNAGSSSTLSGSGMAFRTQLYKDCLENKEIQGAGFDKVLQAAIVGKNKRIAFSEAAIVYDEKTSKPAELVNQRSRWINTWFKYFRLGFVLIARSIRIFSLNQFLFGLVLLRPPLFVFLILGLLFLTVNIFIHPLAALLWLCGFLVFTGCFITSLLSSHTDKRIYKSLYGIPKFMFYQLISLTKIFKANKRSVATQHFHVNKN